MIKNLLTAAAIALLTAGSAFAQQTVFIGTQGYDNLSAAVADATDGQTITITGEQELNGRLGITDKTFTVKGEGENAIIKSAGNYTANLILINGKSNVTFEDVVFDGNNVARSGNKPFEITANAQAAFTNCTFKNFNAERVVFTQRPTTFTNVKAENNTITGEGSGVIYVGLNNKNVTVAGTADYSLAIQNAADYIIGGENLSGNIQLYLGGYAANQTVVQNCSATSVFTLANAPEGYKLTADGNNLVLLYEKDVVLNETTGVSYTSFDAAYKAAQSNDVLILLENITLADRYVFRTNGVTIKGVNPNITITRGNFTNKLFLAAEQNTTLENLVLDCDNKANNNYEFQAGTNTFTLKNVKIVNSQSTKGIFDVKELTRTLKLTDVTKENCTSATPDINLVGKLILSGNTNLSVGVTFNPGTINVDGELTNEQPIELTLATVPELGTAIVSGTTDYKKFTVTNEGFYLNPDKVNNNLVLSDHKTTGIEDVVVDENAPVEYYNLSGMRVNGDNMVPGVYIKRQGAKATKVYVK